MYFSDVFAIEDSNPTQPLETKIVLMWMSADKGQGLANINVRTRGEVSRVRVLKDTSWTAMARLVGIWMNVQREVIFVNTNAWTLWDRTSVPVQEDFDKWEIDVRILTNVLSNKDFVQDQEPAKILTEVSNVFVREVTN